MRRFCDRVCVKDKAWKHPETRTREGKVQEAHWKAWGTWNWEMRKEHQHPRNRHNLRCVPHKSCRLLDRPVKWTRWTGWHGPRGSRAASQTPRRHPSHGHISGFSEPAARGEEGGGNFCKGHGSGPWQPGPSELYCSYGGSSPFRTGTYRELPFSSTLFCSSICAKWRTWCLALLQINKLHSFSIIKG